MSSLTLVRHGQASFALDCYDQLTPLGLAQARALGAWAGATTTKWGEIRYGPRRRQADTASEFAHGTALASDLRLDHGLDEFAEGEEILDAAAKLFGRPMTGAEAPPRAEQLRCYEAAYQAWARGEVDLDGRESYQAFRLRVRHWLDELMAAAGSAGGQRIVAVTSAGVISALVCDVLGLPDEHWTALVRVIGNASLTEVLYSSGRSGLRSFNGTGHLPRGLASAI
ncbi:MAG: histidine phosphatase family protein [Rhodocyclaceae bacterium]|nr:histidine phosphatase family protein [Rhodocyclaceae bacterium]